MKEFVQHDRIAHCLHSLLFAACLTALTPCLAAERPPRYSVIPLGTPASEVEGRYLQPFGINNHGDIVGMEMDIVGSEAPTAFLYREGTFRDLWSEDEPYYPYHLPAINNHGAIVGLAAAREPDPVSPVVLFTYSTAGRNEDFNFARASKLVHRWFHPWDINDRGAIVGELRDTPIGREAAVYESGQMRVLPALSPGAHSFARAINNRGQIIGTSASENFSYPSFPTRAVVWSHGRIQDLGLLPGCLNAEGTDINDHGEAVGSCNDASEESGFILGFAHGFIYRDGVMSRIPTPATQICVPTHINNRGEILMQYFPRLDPEIFFANGTWLYSDGVFHDLDQIVSDATGWRLVWLELFDINDHGQTVGIAKYVRRDGHFFTQGILITPRHYRD